MGYLNPHPCVTCPCVTSQGRRHRTKTRGLSNRRDWATDTRISYENGILCI
jgi:hypothetical protein